MAEAGVQHQDNPSESSMLLGVTASILSGQGQETTHMLCNKGSHSDQCVMGDLVVDEVMPDSGWQRLSITMGLVRRCHRTA